MKHRNITISTKEFKGAGRVKANRTTSNTLGRPQTLTIEDTFDHKKASNYSTQVFKGITGSPKKAETYRKSSKRKSFEPPTPIHQVDFFMQNCSHFPRLMGSFTKTRQTSAKNRTLVEKDSGRLH